MTVQFPNPNFVQEYEYITPNGQRIRYTWDGEKWDTVGASDALRLELDELQDEVDANTGAIGGLEERVSENESDITALKSRVTLVEDGLNNLPPTSGLATRQTVAVEGVLSPGSFVLDLDVTGYCKSGLLIRAESTKPAWITFYSNKTSRANDESRSSAIDPAPGSGVLAEVIATAGGLGAYLTPPANTFNDEGDPVDEIYLKIRGTPENEIEPGPIAVILTYIQLEA